MGYLGFASRAKLYSVVSSSVTWLVVPFEARQTLLAHLYIGYQSFMTSLGGQVDIVNLVSPVFVLADSMSLGGLFRSSACS